MIYTRSNLPAAYGSPFSHYSAVWGTAVRLGVPIIATVAAGQALTTQQQYVFQPYPYLWIYDIVVSAATTGTGGEHSVDVYNAAGVSYLNTPISLPQGIATPTFWSSLNPNAAQRAAATANGYATPFPFNVRRHVDQGKGSYNIDWANQFEVKQSGLFSLRVKTPATTGAITDLRVDILGFVSDVSFAELK